VQFHPRSLYFSGGTAHTAGNASKPTIPRRPYGLDGQLRLRAIKSARLDKKMAFVKVCNRSQPVPTRFLSLRHARTISNRNQDFFFNLILKEQTSVVAC
jgi:hypothetical protein